MIIENDADVLMLELTKLTIKYVDSRNNYRECGKIFRKLQKTVKDYQIKQKIVFENKEKLKKLEEEALRIRLNGK